MRRFLATLLAIFYIVMSLPAYADNVRQSGLYTYEIKGNGTVVITKFDWDANSGQDIFVPMMIDGYTVTTIGAEAFAQTTRDDVIITLPNTITTLETKAFFGANVSAINIPDTLVTIMPGALSFAYEDEVQYILSPTHTKFATIDGVLYDKTKKELVAYPQADYHGFGASEIVIPDGIKSIGAYAFYSHTGAKSHNIYIPDSVQSIGDYAFCNSSLSEVKDRSGIGGAGITTIGKYSFYGTALFDGWHMPSGITQIPEYAFAYAHTGYDEGDGFYWHDNVTTIGDNAFEGFNANESWYGDDSSFGQLPANLRIIGDNAFANMTSCYFVTIPDAVTSIGNNAFYGSEVKSVDVISNTCTIGDYVFANCPNLTAMVLPEGITTIGREVFDKGTIKLEVVPGSYGEVYANENGYAIQYGGESQDDLSWLSE